jgi:hypothetical protein
MLRSTMFSIATPNCSSLQHPNKQVVNSQQVVNKLVVDKHGNADTYAGSVIIRALQCAAWSKDTQRHTQPGRAAQTLLWTRTTQ